MGRLHFEISTNGNCLACLEPCRKRRDYVVNPNRKSTSFKIFMRYLQLNILEFSNFSPAVLEAVGNLPDNVDVLVDLCEACSGLMEKFRVTYQQFEAIKLQVDTCVHKLCDLVRKSDRKEGKRDGAVTAGKGFSKVAINWRKETIKKCSTKISQSQPSVQVCRTNVPNTASSRKSKPGPKSKKIQWEKGVNLGRTPNIYNDKALDRISDMDRIDAQNCTDIGGFEGETMAHVGDGILQGASFEDEEHFGLHDYETEDVKFVIENATTVVQGTSDGGGGSSSENEDDPLYSTRQRKRKTKQTRGPRGKRTRSQVSKATTDGEDGTCVHCGKHFSHMLGLRRHLRNEHLEERPYKCSYCNDGFNDAGNYHRHVTAMHTMDKLKDRIPLGTTQDQFKRVVQSIVDQHEIVEGDKKACALCGTAVTRLHVLKLHIMDQHQDTIIEKLEDPEFLNSLCLQEGEEEEFRYKCTTCGKSFNVPETLKRHMKTHSMPETLTCSYCGTLCAHVYHYERHLMSIHTWEHFADKVREYCASEEKLEDAIQAVMAQGEVFPQDRDKKYGCPQCSKRFPAPALYRTHVLKHHFEAVVERLSGGGTNTNLP